MREEPGGSLRRGCDPREHFRARLPRCGQWASGPIRSFSTVSGAAGRKLASGRAAAIPVVQTAKTGKGDNLAELGRLCGPVLRRVLPQGRDWGQVHSVPVVPVAELAKQALGVPFV